MSIFIGIDPGLSGACATISADGPHVLDTPTIQTEKKREYDVKQMWLMLDHLPQEGQCFAVLESVHAFPGQGVTSMFRIGYGLGLWVALLTATQIPFELVAPQTWKKAMLKDGGKDKAASLVKARQLFPTVDLSRVKDEGKAEALLMAAYAQRLQGGAS